MDAKLSAKNSGKPTPKQKNEEPNEKIEPVKVYDVEMNDASEDDCEEITRKKRRIFQLDSDQEE